MDYTLFALSTTPRGIGFGVGVGVGVRVGVLVGVGVRVGVGVNAGNTWTVIEVVGPAQA